MGGGDYLGYNFDVHFVLSMHLVFHVLPEPMVKSNNVKPPVKRESKNRLDNNEARNEIRKVL